MVFNRPWKRWFRNFSKELNSTSGLAGLGGAILTIISFFGLNTFSGQIAIYTTIIGIVIMGIAFLIAAYKAIPSRFRHPREFVGLRLDLDQLNNVYPPLLKFGIVGTYNVGKSTLINAVLQTTPLNQRTDKVHAYVHVLPKTGSINYLAMLDGTGQMFADQFKIASKAEILIVIIDHNQSNEIRNLDNDRIRQHRNFQEQLRRYLSEENKILSHVHLLFNKRDLWEHSSISQNEQQNIRHILSNEEQNWQNSNLATTVTSAKHSNYNQQDIVNLVEQIHSCISCIN